MKRYLVAGLIIALCILAASAAAAGAGPRGQPEQNDHPEPVNVKVDVTAICSWVKTITYDWTVDKSVTPDTLVLGSGESGSVQYTVETVRTEVSNVDVYSVDGVITIHNEDKKSATSNLVINSQLQYRIGEDGKWLDLPDACWALSPVMQIEPEEAGTYEYRIEFTPISGTDVQYRNRVTADVAAPASTKKGEAAFDIPATPLIVYIDADADVTDLLSCPAGFSCTSAGPDSRQFSMSGSEGYSVSITNDAASCEQTVELINTATLTERDTREILSDTATVTIWTGACPSAGCTYSIGYWKNHAGFGPQKDVLNGYLPISLGAYFGAIDSAQTAVDILKMNVYGSSSNGITKLYAQLLAAKLNIANGANDDAIEDTVGASDAFLESYSHLSWDSLTKPQKSDVEAWKDTLDDYNNGLIGPGHCPDDDSA